jgi:hypothetical protein
MRRDFWFLKSQSLKLRLLWELWSKFISVGKKAIALLWGDRFFSIQTKAVGGKFN